MSVNDLNFEDSDFFSMREEEEAASKMTVAIRVSVWFQENGEEHFKQFFTLESELKGKLETISEVIEISKATNPGYRGHRVQLARMTVHTHTILENVRYDSAADCVRSTDDKKGLH